MKIRHRSRFNTLAGGKRRGGPLQNRSRGLADSRKTSTSDDPMTGRDTWGRRGEEERQGADGGGMVARVVGLARGGLHI